MEILSQILSNANLNLAYHKVVNNKGTAGVDKMTTGQLKGHLKVNLESIKEQIKTRKYKPSPVLRVEIPKPNGGVRNLGIPTVTDRFIQQAIAQVISPIFDKQFSEYSYGFRLKRYAEMAIVKTLDFYAPHLLEYLPSGATISRLYYVDEVEKWTDPISINNPIADRQILYANFTVDQKTGDEVIEDENGYAPDIIVTYKVTSESQRVVVYYHIMVIDAENNVNFIFDIYHRTIEGNTITDVPIKESILKGSVIHINLVNFNTDTEVGANNIMIV